MDTNHLGAFIKYKRNELNITQEELAAKAGVGLRFIRELEQGKTTLRIDKVNQVLALFGFELKPERDLIDPYEIWMNYSNKGIVITTKNREKIYGVILNEILDDNNKIVAWHYVSNNNAVEYQKTKNKQLLSMIKHSDINNISLQNHE